MKQKITEFYFFYFRVCKVHYSFIALLFCLRKLSQVTLEKFFIEKINKTKRFF